MRKHIKANLYTSSQSWSGSWSRSLFWSRSWNNNLNCSRRRQ